MTFVRKLPDPLRTLLDLSEGEKVKRGMQHTLREIYPRPATEIPLGLRHGPLSSVADQIVAFLANDARRRGYELDLLREHRKRLGRVRTVVTGQ